MYTQKFGKISPIVGFTDDFPADSDKKTGEHLSPLAELKLPEDGGSVPLPLPPRPAW